MKKMISLVLTLALVFALCVPALADGEGDLLIAPNPNATEQPWYADSTYNCCEGNRACPMWYYGDLPGNTWFHDGIHFCLDTDLMVGRDDGYFYAGGATTRFDLVRAMYQYALAVGADVSAGEDTNILSYEDAFDIPQGYYEAFQWACSASLIGGETPNLFPTEEMTREEVIVMLYEFAQWLGMDVSVAEDTNILSYNDAFSITEGCYEAFQWACGTGILQGTAAGNLNPHNTATRAHTSVILMRFATMA